MEENCLHNQHNVVNFLLQHAKLAQHITNIRQEEKAGRYFLCGLVLGMIKEHFFLQKLIFHSEQDRKQKQCSIFDEIV